MLLGRFGRPSFAEGKTELGMDHYEMSKYPGWHYHMLMTMLMHFFLRHLKLRLGKKPWLYCVAAADGIRTKSCPYRRTQLRTSSTHGLGAAAQSSSLSLPQKAARGQGLKQMTWEGRILLATLQGRDTYGRAIR
jgi:hypothetical protein